MPASSPKSMLGLATIRLSNAITGCIFGVVRFDAAVIPAKPSTGITELLLLVE
jgi:hypothetical protein